MTRTSPPPAASTSGPELVVEELGARQAEPDAADAERRVGLRPVGLPGGRLVAADVERPEHDRPLAHRLADPGVEVALLGDRWRRPPAEEQQLGPDEPDALRAGRGGRLRLEHRPDVRASR